MLIFAAIHIVNGRSRFVPDGEPGTETHYSDSPLFLARLFRRENARALHIIDHDAILSGELVNTASIRAITEAEDVRIPIQLCGGIRSYDDAVAAFEALNVDRIVLGSAAVENDALISRLVHEFSAKKVVAGLTVHEGRIVYRGGERSSNESPLAFVQRMKRLGVQRIVFTRRDSAGGTEACIAEVVSLAHRSGLSFTVAGGVSSHSDLRKMQSALPRHVDSIVLDEPLYRNNFPCQAIWRSAEKAQFVRGMFA